MASEEQPTRVVGIHIGTDPETIHAIKGGVIDVVGACAGRGDNVAIAALKAYVKAAQSVSVRNTSLSNLHVHDVQGYAVEMSEAYESRIVDGLFNKCGGGLTASAQPDADTEA